MEAKAFGGAEENGDDLVCTTDEDADLAGFDSVALEGDDLPDDPLGFAERIAHCIVGGFDGGIEDRGGVAIEQ